MNRAPGVINVLVILLGIGCNAAASVLVKSGMSRPRMASRAGLLLLLHNGPLLAAIVLYASAFVFFAIALGRMPLHVVHPVMTSAAIAVVAVLSRVVFHEPLPWTACLGIGFVIAGVWLISWRSG
jgi:multidrug transporter EmrE-like cation transporter